MVIYLREENKAASIPDDPYETGTKEVTQDGHQA